MAGIGGREEESISGDAFADPPDDAGRITAELTGITGATAVGPKPGNGNCGAEEPWPEPCGASKSHDPSEGGVSEVAAEVSGPRRANSQTRERLREEKRKRGER